MSKSCTRFLKPITPIDIANSNINWINVNVIANSSKFTTDNNRSGEFHRNSLIFSEAKKVDLNFANVFTIVFWAKAKVGKITDTVYKNKIILCLDDNNIIKVDIPDSVIMTDWNYYEITRTADNSIYIRINGKNIKAATTNTTGLDLLGNSYIYIGNNNRFSTGFILDVDDILIVDTVLNQNEYTDLPTDYVDIGRFFHCLFIKPSTGEVWGYQNEN